MGLGERSGEGRSWPRHFLALDDVREPLVLFLRQVHIQTFLELEELCQLLIQVSAGTLARGYPLEKLLCKRPVLDHCHGTNAGTLLVEQHCLRGSVRMSQLGMVTSRRCGTALLWGAQPSRNQPADNALYTCQQSLFLVLLLRLPLFCSGRDITRIGKWVRGFDEARTNGTSAAAGRCLAVVHPRP